MGLNLIVQGNTYNPDPAKKEAANTLRLYIKAQGTKISSLNYQAETSVLSKIADALKTDPKQSVAVAKLDLGAWVTSLETANNEFETTFKSRNTDISANAEVPSFGELKKQAIPLYNELVNLIESRLVIAKADGQPTAPYQALINEINTLIDSYSSYISNGKPKPKPGNPS